MASGVFWHDGGADTYPEPGFYGDGLETAQLGGGEQVILWCISQIARAGATRSDYHPPRHGFLIDGVEVGQAVLRRTVRIVDQIDEAPTTMSFSMRLNVPGFTCPPNPVGRVVKAFIEDANFLFLGRITKATVHLPRQAKRFPRMDVEAIDHTWEMDWNPLGVATDRNGKIWAGVSATSILKDLVRHFLPTNFTYGVTTIEAGMATLDDFSVDRKEKPTQAISRLMKQVGGYWFVDYDRRIWAYTTAASITPPAPLTNSPTVSGDYWDFEWSEDITQLRTRVMVYGRSTQLRSTAEAGDTSMSVDDSFGFTAGNALVGRTEVVEYASVGANVISGMTIPTTRDVPQGDPVQLYSERISGPARSILAGRGITSPVSHITENIEEDALSTDGADFVGDGELAVFGRMEEGITFTTRDIYARAGALVTVDVTTPIVISGTYIIQNMTMTFPHENMLPTRVCVAGTFKRNLYDLLTRMRAGTTIK